jgi:hypothetical protein
METVMIRNILQNNQFSTTMLDDEIRRVKRKKENTQQRNLTSPENGQF